MTIHVGLLLFPRLTQLDLTGPYEVFARAPDTEVHLVWKTRDPVVSDRGLTILPTVSFDTCPPLDVLCVPGGPGQADLMADSAALDFLRRQASGARYVTSVCTGSLVLGAAGLLRGYRATTHWLSLDLLAALGATPIDERVVIDRNRITGGGVTAGIDFALAVVAELHGRERAQAIALQIEYDPHPPITGSPRHADRGLVERLRESTKPFQDKRRQGVLDAAKRLGL
jgi:cyclohexyl-isocyanide hydratase